MAFKKYYSIYGPVEYRICNDEGCPHWRQVAGQYDLMEHYAERVWKCVGYFNNKELAEKVARLLSEDEK